MIRLDRRLSCYECFSMINRMQHTLCCMLYIILLFYRISIYLRCFFLCSDQRMVCVDCLLLKLFFSLDPNRPISPGSPCGESGSNDLEWIC